METLNLRGMRETSRYAIKAFGYFTIMFILYFLVIIPIQALLSLLFPPQAVTNVLGYVTVVLMVFFFYFGVMKVLYDENIISPYQPTAQFMNYKKESK